MATLLITIAGTLAGAQAAPDVTVSEQNRLMVVENGLVRVMIGPRGRLAYIGRPGGGKLITGGYFDIVAGHGHQGTTGTPRVKRQSADLVEIVARSKTDPKHPFQVDMHYVVRRGVPGVYLYAVYTKPKGAAAALEQSRMVLRVNSERLQEGVILSGRRGHIPTPAELAAGKTLWPKEATRFADGTVDCKYYWAVWEEQPHTYGILGPGEGLWMVSASNEYLPSGPAKQDLTIHSDHKSHVMLRMLHSNHFRAQGKGIGRLSFSPEESWSKLYGPWLLAVTAGTHDEMSASARSLARETVSAWPFQWMDHPLYPLDRGTVKGRLVDGVGQAIAHARVVLGANGDDWFYQGRDYLFWTRTDTTGNFAIPNVRPGTYRPFAWVPGRFDSLAGKPIVVHAGQTAALGSLSWPLPKTGTVIWQIGVPDRLPRELASGSEPRHWDRLDKVRRRFPHGASYVIGSSRPEQDWPYAHFTSEQADGRWRSPVHKILFTTEPSTAKSYTLTIATAGGQAGRLSIHLNGKHLETFSPPSDGFSIWMRGEGGVYGCREIRFDASLLKKGTNTLAIHEVSERQYHGVVYDCIRLQANP